MVFQRGKDNFIARLEKLPAIGLSDEVDAFRAPRTKTISLADDAPRKA